MANNQGNRDNRGSQGGGSGSGRGFASMDPERRREIASRGGKASGGNFANDTARAAEAGRRGGESRANRSNNQ